MTAIADDRHEEAEQIQRHLFVAEKDFHIAREMRELEFRSIDAQDDLESHWPRGFSSEKTGRVGKLQWPNSTSISPRNGSD